MPLNVEFKLVGNRRSADSDDADVLVGKVFSWSRNG